MTTRLRSFSAHIPAFGLLVVAIAGCPTPGVVDKVPDADDTADPHSTSEETGASETGSRDTSSEETAESETGETGETGEEPEPCDTAALGGIAEAKLVGEEAGGAAGYTLEGVDDVDGDGWGDVLIGAPYFDPGGRAYLVRGPLHGRECLSDADARFVAEGADDFLGYTLAGVGDVDMDGTADILIGSPGDASTAAWLVLGPVSGDVHVEDADGLFIEPEWKDYAGMGLAGPGDMNGDGWRDVVIGAPGGTGFDVESTRGHCADDDWEEYRDEHGAGAGVTYLMLGPVSAERSFASADARVMGEDGWDQSGVPLAGAGDVNGDGVEDLAIGARGNCESGISAGAAYVVHSPISGDLYLGDADLKLVAEETAEGTGFDIDGGADGDGDGLPDLLVTEPIVSVGRTYLIYGPGTGSLDLASVDATIFGEAYGESAGLSASWAGDADGDGFQEVIIGAPGEDSSGLSSGAAYLVLGPVTGSHSLSSADVKLIADARGILAGFAVSAAGDVNNDGLSDVLVGGPGDDEGGEDAGATWLVLGAPGLVGGTL